MDRIFDSATAVKIFYAYLALQLGLGAVPDADIVSPAAIARLEERMISIDKRLEKMEMRYEANLQGRV